MTMNAEGLQLATESVASQPSANRHRIVPAADCATWLLWGWPQLRQSIPLCRRTLEKLVSSGEFPAPVRFVGRRPLWDPEHVRQWAKGERP
jgi:hypothetical protein